MIDGRHRIVFLALLLLSAVPLVAAAVPSRPWSALRHDTWNTDDGLPQSTVAAMVQDADGYLWIGTQEGLTRFDGLRFTVYDRGTSPVLRHNSITALLVDPGGGLWVGTQDGLHHFHDGRFTAIPDPPNSPMGGVEEIIPDRAGGLWIASRRGVFHYRGGSFTVYGLADGLLHEEVYSLYLDGGGVLWIGTRKGLQRLVGGRVEDLPEERRFSDLLVAAIHAHTPGELWLSTEGGLFRLPAAEGPPVPVLPRVFVLESLLDRQGILWIGSLRGLFRWDGERATAFTSQDGLLGDTVYSLLEDLEGAVWVGTYKGGVNRFRPPPETAPPGFLNLVLETVRVDEASISPHGSPVLPADLTELELHFAAIHFDHPESIRYRYRLEGYPESWNEAEDRRYARYNIIPPGNYKLLVEAYDPLRPAVGTATIQFPFSIPPRFYETSTFFALCALALLFSGYLLNRLWASRLLLRQETLEEAVRQRTTELIQQKNSLAETHRLLERTFRRRKKANQELKALYREKSDFLAIAAHDLRAPLVNLRGFAFELRTVIDLCRNSFHQAGQTLPAATHDRLTDLLNDELPEALGFIDSSANQLEQLIGPILHLSRISRRPLDLREIETGQLLGEVLESLQGIIADHGAEVIHGPLPAVVADPEALADIFHELLNNSLEFLAPGRPGRIEISGQESDGDVTLHVRDNGRGIAATEDGRVFRIFGHTGRSKAPGRGMGLVYVRTLIHRHGGRIWYESEPGKGTIFSFTLPRETLSRQ